MSIDISSQELLVVKIGTDTLTNGGGIDQKVLRNVTGEISDLIREGIRVVLVSSGAYGSGIPSHATPEQLELLKKMRQTVSTLGQHELMGSFGYHFENHGIKVAQWLTEPHDFGTEENREIMLENFGNLDELERIWKRPIVPILNTNDFVTRAGFETDNDRLAGFATSIFPAIRKRLVLLTNMRGLMADLHDDRSVIREIRVGEEDCRQYICSDTSPNGSGDMGSKYDVAEAAALEGHCSFIGDGKVQGAIRRLLERIDGTFFRPPGYTDDS